MKKGEGRKKCKMRITEFNNVSSEEWDEYVRRIPESTYLHSSAWLNYLNTINGIEGSKSFIFSDGKTPLAVCPLAICKVNSFGKEYMEATFSGFPSVYPAVIELPATQRRRIVRKIFNLIHQILAPYNIKRIELYRHPINLNVLNGDFDAANMAEAISYGYLYYMKNTIIIELRKEESQLMSEMSQYQRKHIRKSKRQGLIVKEYRGEIENLDKVFSDFQTSHFKSAGRLTRPIESWNIMKDLIRQNKATLFTVSIENGKDISYLYCGEFDKFSFGWSQVNIDEYEGRYSSRHLLEWEAMMFYKKRGFYYYELGIKYDSPQFNYIPTEKETTISQFKERYGGKLYCCFYFEKFFDKELFDIFYNHRLEEFLASNSFAMLNEPI